MRLLLRLYPRSWRERYGDEMAELLQHQPWSPSLAIDLIAGAIDARLNSKLFVSEAKGEKHMFSKAAGLRCAGFGPNVTSRDQWMSVGMMLGVTLVLTIFWLVFVGLYRDNRYVLSFCFVPYTVAYAMGLPFTSLKGRSRRAQVVCIGGIFLVIAMMWLLVGFILTARM